MKAIIACTDSLRWFWDNLQIIRRSFESQHLPGHSQGTHFNYLFSCCLISSYVYKHSVGMAARTDKHSRINTFDPLCFSKRNAIGTQDSF